MRHRRGRDVLTPCGSADLYVAALAPVVSKKKPSSGIHARGTRAGREERALLPHEHEERTPSALAHGPAKPSDIENVRDQVASAETKAAHRATRHWKRVMDRAVRRDPGPPER
jgi:hypothetical protein